MRCRSCQGSCELLLDLGNAPLANALRPAGQKEKAPRYPLAIMLCEACALVQLTETVSPSVLFGDYRYASKTSNEMLERIRALAEKTTQEEHLNAQSLVVEIGSNDGYLLHFYAHATRVLGVEPAERLARIARACSIPTLEAFFSEKVAKEIRNAHGAAQVIHAHNVLAHIPDIQDAMRGIQELLSPEGVAIVEVPDVGALVSSGAFDTIYHEHVYYFSLTSLRRVAALAGLRVVDAEPISIHGGSLRVFLRHAYDPRKPSERVDNLLQLEEFAGHPSYYVPNLIGKVHKAKKTRSLLEDLRDRSCGFTAAYGASAKGTTFLHVTGITEEHLDFVVDKNPLKVGMWLPDLDITILPTSALLEKKPSHALLLTWNFREEILKEQEAYRQQGGRFIVPIPRLEIV